MKSQIKILLHANKLASICLLLTFFLSGCSSFFLSGVRQDVSKIQDQAQVAQNALRKGSQKEFNNNVEVIDEQWVPSRKIKRKTRIYEIDHQILINKKFQSLRELTNHLTALTKIPFYVDVQQNARASSPLPGQIQLQDSAPNLQNVATSIMSSSEVDRATPKSLSFSGGLEDFLNETLPLYSYYWEYQPDNHAIRLFKSQTKTFRIAALPGDINFQNNIGNTATSASGGGGGSVGSASSSGGGIASTSSQKTGVTSAVSIWKSTEDVVKSMLSPTGKAIMSAATGTITVTDIPTVISDIGKYIDNQNTSLTKEVIINVRVLSVDVKNVDSYGVNWNAVINSATKLSGALSTTFAPVISGGSLTATIPASAEGAAAGSSAILSALSEQGDVSELTSTSVTTLNNQPAPTQVGSQIAYLQSSTTTLTTNVGATTTLVPGTVNVGYALNVVPHIMDNDDLLLQYSIDISTLVSMVQVSSGSSTIQTPTIDSKNLFNRVKLRSGETLALSGFEKISSSADSKGIGSADNLLAGGSMRGSKSKSVLVVLIQPLVVGR
jgi:type IVB pilus formation R64 PilN family outer membrane protein